jgi:hypothetical protein
MKRLTIILFLLLTNISQAQDGNSGIIYGDDHAFALTAPNGWILDNSADKDFMRFFTPKKVLGSSQ